MGTSAPPRASFDLIASYARRRGGEVEIVLAEPELEATGQVAVLLERFDEVVEVTGEFVRFGESRRLVARIPRQRLTDGRWALRLRPEGADETRLNARLLVQGERPLVLLWGATNPRSVSPTPARRRRAAAVAGKALDRTLTVLAPERASRIRARVRRTARRVLS